MEWIKVNTGGGIFCYHADVTTKDGQKALVQVGDKSAGMFLKPGGGFYTHADYIQVEELNIQIIIRKGYPNSHARSYLSDEIIDEIENMLD